MWHVVVGPGPGPQVALFPSVSLEDGRLSSPVLCVRRAREQPALAQPAPRGRRVVRTQ